MEGVGAEGQEAAEDEGVSDETCNGELSLGLLQLPHGAALLEQSKNVASSVHFLSWLPRKFSGYHSLEFVNWVL